MLGVLGISDDLLKWTAAERALGAQMIALYKEIRPLVQLGDQYWLRPAQGSAFTAVQYVSKDRRAGVLFAFRIRIPEPVELPPLYLRGLDPTARYTVEGFPGVRSGAAWMNTGLRLRLIDLESAVRRIQQVG
jgi:alpha-galactosidase